MRALVALAILTSAAHAQPVASGVEPTPRASERPAEPAPVPTTVPAPLDEPDWTAAPSPRDASGVAHDDAPTGSLLWIDAFAIDRDVNGARLCFTDLLFAYRLRAPTTHYKVDAFDAAGKRIANARVLGAMTDGRTCVNGVALASDYTIVRLRVQRSGREMPPVLVHIARDANGLRIIGLRRR